MKRLLILMKMYQDITAVLAESFMNAEAKTLEVPPEAARGLVMAYLNAPIQLYGDGVQALFHDMDLAFTACGIADLLSTPLLPVPQQEQPLVEVAKPKIVAP